VRDLEQRARPDRRVRARQTAPDAGNGIMLKLEDEGMKAEIDIDMETARIAAALAEIKREGAQRKACYPRFVAAGKLDAAESRRRLTALADACRIVQAVLADVEELPFLADGEQPAVAVAAAMAPKPLPYDQGESVKDAPPVCRLCLHATAPRLSGRADPAPQKCGESPSGFARGALRSAWRRK
jgi:hypothetical protein